MWCSKCKKDKEPADFYASSRLEGSWCKVCRGTYLTHELVPRLRLRVLAVLGDCCKHCGTTDRRVFEVDHVNGDGHITRNRKTPARRHTVLYAVLKHPERFQLLCCNCIRIKAQQEGLLRPPWPDRTVTLSVAL